MIASEEDFIRRNIAGQKSAQAKGRRRRLSRVSRLSSPEGEEGVMSLRLEADARGGDQVLVAENVRVGMGERVLVEQFSARVGRGDVVGFIGPNGAGKTTLLRAFLGERPLEAGEVRIPDSVRVAHYRQDLAQVPTNRSLYDLINDLRPSWGRGAIQGHLGRFGFSGDSVLRQAGNPVRGRACPGRTGHDHAVGCEPAHFRRAHQSPRRRVDRGAGGCDRGLRRHRTFW